MHLLLSCIFVPTADDEDDEEMIEAVPQEEMINIPGLGPMPIRNLPAGMAGMGELPKPCTIAC